VIVIGPDGRVRAKLSPPLDPGPMAEYLARLQIAYRRGQEPVTQ
jgi:protein SCO1/2